MYHSKITSTQNLKIKNLLSLQKSRERRNQELFIIEGKTEIMLAIQAGYEINTLFFCEDFIAVKEITSLQIKNTSIVPVSKEVFTKIAVRETSGGMLAVAIAQKHSLHNIKLRPCPLIIVLEGVEKPGNLGAVLRTADATQVDAVIICNPETDFYNPNVIRSSLGCVFTNQIASASSKETIEWLQSNTISIYCTYLKAHKSYHKIDFTKPSAIVMGTESSGLSDIWVENSSASIIIPMLGKIDSLNVSNATAVVVYEAMRQRNFNL